MRYTISQKIFAIGNDYAIKDENGKTAFNVDGKVFTIRQTLELQDANGNELAVIRKKILAIGPTYEVTSHGQTIAVVKKHLFTLFRCRFSVDVPGPDDLEAVGNFTDHEYEFTRDGKRVGAVSKRWFTIRDTYGVEVEDDADTVPIIASALVIDLACHEDKH